MMKQSNFNKINGVELAKSTAISALSLLVGKEEHLERFISLSGIDISEVRELANTTEFLAAVLDYYLSDEKLLLEFCHLENLKPERVMKAAHDLGGGIWERETA
jgi:Protein of unknown function (DUF3572)